MALALGQIEGCRRVRRPLYLFNGQIHQFDPVKNRYVAYSAGELASNICAEAEVDGLLREDARFYDAVIRELKLRVARLPQFTDAPQFLVWNGQFLRRAPYHIALTNGIFLADRFVQGRGRYFVRPNHRFFTRVARSFAYDPDAKCPLWEAML
ncbi:MAG: hypothetical protein KDD69_19840, partial [Bdellovibrionales bacterium]|nr:hypothetical protein [Bdellovibrionales bacterium]